MIDLSNIKAPGWQRIVADLSAPAPDDRAFLLRLLAALVQVSGARQGVLFAVTAAEGEDAAEPKSLMVWPPAPEHREILERGGAAAESHVAQQPVPEGIVEAQADAKIAARTAARSRQTQAFSLSTEDLLYDPSGAKGFLLAVPVPGGLPNEAASVPLRGVVTLLLDNRSRQALQTTLALVEVLVGYVFNHTAQQVLRRVRASSASLELAARLIASVNNARTFKGATLQLVNDLCRQLGADRVVLGWIKNAGPSVLGAEPEPDTVQRWTKVVAMSDTEQLDHRMAMVQKIECAMDECLDQEQAILFPLPVGTTEQDVLLTQAVTHAHRELAAGDAKLKVCSVPLRVDQRVVGVLLVEQTSDANVEVGTVELLQATMDLVTPVLEVRRTDDRSIALRTWDWMVKTAAWAVGPKHTVWKAAAVLVFVVSVLMVFVKTPYRVGAAMEVQPYLPRTVSVPFDAKIKSVGPGIEAGAKVKAGDLLLELDTTEMQLRLLDAQSQIVQAEKEADEAMKKGDQAQAQRATAKADQARAQQELWRTRISQSRLTAPISGSIIAGDVKDKVGATVQLGQALFQIADTSDVIVLARVDDRDIALIREGMTGQVAAKAKPGEKFDFTVERIVPLSQPKEGKNLFEVRARLKEAPAWFKPGMEGQARFDSERHSLAWIASRRVLDQLKVWLWW
jgi:hypothetical protein